MRKVIETTLVSLDGVVEDVSQWGRDYFDAAWWEASLRTAEACDALLMGRNTYEMLGGETRALLSAARAGEPLPPYAEAYASRLDDIRKYVFSSTLKEPDWANSVLVRGDVAAEVAKLKREEGQDILIYGHGPLGQALLKHDLLDEMHFSIHPALVGRGQTMLRENVEAELRLIESRTLANGVVVVRYEPIRG